MRKLLLPAVIVASAAAAQERPNVPAGNPLGAAAPVQAAPDQALVEAQRARAVAAAQARVRANQQAMADAFAQSPAPAEDQLRPRPAPTTSFGQPLDTADAPARSAPSPYGGYYQIRTPWDRR